MERKFINFSSKNQSIHFPLLNKQLSKRGSPSARNCSKQEGSRERNSGGEIAYQPFWRSVEIPKGGTPMKRRARDSCFVTPDKRERGTSGRKTETGTHEYSMDGRLRNAEVSLGQVITTVSYTSPPSTRANSREKGVQSHVSSHDSMRTIPEVAAGRFLFTPPS